MKRLFILFITLFQMVAFAYAQEREVKFKLVHVSDVHGNFFPYDFIRRTPMSGGLSRVHSLVRQMRQEYGDRLLLVDGGDLLQGQPSAYYSNFIDTTSIHMAMDMLNYMGFNAAAVGNHDIEAGVPVYSRCARQADFPMLGANILDAHTGGVDNRFRPYTLIERDGVRIAILGLISPAVPVWLPEKLWEGLRFEDMEAAARKWLPIIRETERPHIIVGLFHSGAKGGILGGKYRENASTDIARNVPGFDVILMGHDHLRACHRVINCVGDSVLLMNPSSNAMLVSDVDITLRMDGDRLLSKTLDGRLTATEPYGVSDEFMQRFDAQYTAVKKFVDKKIGSFSRTISTRPAYFGPSAFIDLIHTLQLAISGADISLAAPLSFDAQIEKGDIRVSDMFNLYKYENMLYTMRLTGREVKNALEYSYALWTNRMRSKDDCLLLFRDKRPNEFDDRTPLLNTSFNFDSAAGIRYTVDVTRPTGDKVHIISMADGTPFDLDKHYRVAVNSYRGNGGGSILTEGAGIPQEQLPGRILTSTEKDLRYYLMQYIEEQGTIEPRALNHWKFIPEEWVEPAAKRDYKILFGE